MASLSGNSNSRTALLKANLAWARSIVEPLHHSERRRWTASVLPNNFLFYLRTEEKRMRAIYVGSNLHSSHEFVVSLSGAGHVCLGESIYRVTPGTAFLAKPGQFHYYFDFGPGPFSWLLFKFDLSREESQRLKSQSAVLLSEEDMALLQQIGRQYVEGDASERDSYQVAAKMGELLGTLDIRPRADAVGTLADPEFRSCQVLYRIAHFILEHIDQTIRIQDIADHLGVSESNLRKVFRDEVKTSLGLYLRNTRFSCGVQLLRTTGMSISEISQHSGFESVASFSQAFRKSYGMTPSSYRQQFSNTSAEAEKDGLEGTRLLHPEFSR